MTPPLALDWRCPNCGTKNPNTAKTCTHPKCEHGKSEV